MVVVAMQRCAIHSKQYTQNALGSSAHGAHKHFIQLTNNVTQWSEKVFGHSSTRELFWLALFDSILWMKTKKFEEESNSSVFTYDHVNIVIGNEFQFSAIDNDPSCRLLVDEKKWLYFPLSIFK